MKGSQKEKGGQDILPLKCTPGSLKGDGQTQRVKAKETGRANYSSRELRSSK